MSQETGEQVLGDGQEALHISQINQSEAGPDIVQINKDDDVFKDPSSLDFLEALKIQPGSRDFSKESLYTKFDPLVKIQTPVKNSTAEVTPTKNPAIEVLDKLISLTPSPKQPVNIVSPIKKEMADSSKTPSKGDPKLSNMDHGVLESELAKLHELLLKQEKLSQDKLNENENKVSKLTGQICLLQDKLKESEEREKSLAKKVNEQTQSQLQLNIVMQEYERLISKLTAEIENDKKANVDKIEALTIEKDSALTHLNNVEAAFSDVHEKYEKCKKVVDDYKKNELKMRSIINEQIETIKTKEKQLDTVQKSCTSQLENIHKEMEHMRISHDQELTRSRALLRKTDLKVITLQESLEQKIKENQELTTICDDLIEARAPTHH